MSIEVDNLTGQIVVINESGDVVVQTETPVLEVVDTRPDALTVEPEDRVITVQPEHSVIEVVTPEVVVQLVGCEAIPEPAPPPAGDGGVINAVSGEAIQAGRVVYTADDGKVYLDDATVARDTPPIGIALDTVTAADSPIRVQVSGVVPLPSATLSAGQPVFLGPVGALTQTEPSPPARSVVVGTPAGPTALRVEPGPVVHLAA